MNKHIPEKSSSFSNDDKEYITSDLKSLDRRRKRVYYKQGKSDKWNHLNMIFKPKLSYQKKNFYNKIIKDLKNSNPRQWFSKLKRMMCYDKQISSNVEISEICHLTDEEQAELLADHFSSVSREYEPLMSEDIKYPDFLPNSIPVFTADNICFYLRNIKTNKANVSGDILSLIIQKMQK